MRVGRTRVGVLLLCALMVGCTSEPAVAPSPGPSVSAATPTESAAERQERLDYAAAEKAYRTFRAEYGRVLRAGGAKEPTKVMKETAGGDYLETFVEVAQAFDENGSRDVGVEIIGYVRPSGYQPDSIALRVCEDSSNVLTIRRAGSKARGEVRTAELEVRRVDTSWKVWSGSGALVNSCD